MSKTKKAETPAPARLLLEERAAELLRLYPELGAKLLDAMRTEHFMVTVHCQKVIPARAGDLQHYLMQHQYPPNDIVSSLKHIATVHNAKIDPNADTKGAQGWV